MPSEDGEGEAMVIECESCSTRFHLADGRIPAKGARVRCSNCHHRFHVKPPPKTPDTASDAGQNSLSGTAESVPPQTATSQAPAMPASEPVSHQVQESVSKPVSKRHSDPDLDNPEFLFDTPSP